MKGTHGKLFENPGRVDRCCWDCKPQLKEELPAGLGSNYIGWIEKPVADQVDKDRLARLEHNIESDTDEELEKPTSDVRWRTKARHCASFRRRIPEGPPYEAKENQIAGLMWNKTEREKFLARAKATEEAIVKSLQTMKIDERTTPTDFKDLMGAGSRAPPGPSAARAPIMEAEEREDDLRRSTIVASTSGEDCFN